MTVTPVFDMVRGALAEGKNIPGNKDYRRNNLTTKVSSVLVLGPEIVLVAATVRVLEKSL